MDVNKITNLVLSGGSIRGYAFIGAIKALTEFNILKNVTTFCGTSIGGVISLILNLNYTYDEVYAILIKLDILMKPSSRIQANIDILEAEHAARTRS